MPSFDVEMKTTTYTEYTVDAPDSDSARKMVENEAVRPTLRSRESDRGDGKPVWVATHLLPRKVFVGTERV